MSPLLLLALAIAAKDPATLRAEATKDFRAKRYAAACAKFREAARLAPENAPLASDLGLCLAKIGDAEGARTANLRAIALGDARTRANAYYNLGALGDRVEVPEAGQCSELPSSVPGCDKSLHGCAFEWGTSGDEAWSGTKLRIAVGGQSAAGPPSDEPITQFGFDAASGRPVPSAAAGQAVDVLIEQSLQYTGALLGRVGRADAADAAEEGRRGSAQKEMYAFADRNSASCRIVALDACRGRVGLVCVQDGVHRTWAHEVELAPSGR